MKMSKNITIITANYYPEDTAIGLYTTQFSEFLNKNNFNITILTGFPYYPKWEIYDNYKNKPLFYDEEYNGIKIHRYKQFVPKKVTFLSRLLMILSFNLGLIINLLKLKNQDLIICIIPFTTNCFILKLYSVFFRSKIWFHVQDLELDLFIESGIGKKGNFFVKIFFKIMLIIESTFLKSSDIISTISYSMINKIKSKTNNKDVFYFPNWVSLNHINPDNFNFHKYFDQSKFTLLYSGNIGEKQDWRFFIDFCNKIKNSDEIEIIIVGNGGFYPELKNMIKGYNFIKLKELVPYNELSDLLCSTDLHFLFQKIEVLDSVMPSKLLGMMASKKPSIITGNEFSEVKEIMSKSGGGYYISSNNPDEVYEKVIALKMDKELSKKIGLNAREFVKNNFSDDSVLNSFLKKINSLINE